MMVFTMMKSHSAFDHLHSMNGRGDEPALA